MFGSCIKRMKIVISICICLHYVPIYANSVEPQILFNNASGNNNVFNISVSGQNNRTVVSVGDGMSATVSSKDLNLSAPTTIAVQLSVTSADLSKTFMQGLYQLSINANGKSGSSTLVNCTPKPTSCDKIIFSWPHGSFPTYTADLINLPAKKSIQN